MSMSFHMEDGLSHQYQIVILQKPNLRLFCVELQEVLTSDAKLRWTVGEPLHLSTLHLLISLTSRHVLVPYVRSCPTDSYDQTRY